jgi:hypothetical protein
VKITCNNFSQFKQMNWYFRVVWQTVEPPFFIMVQYSWGISCVVEP